MKHRRRTSEPRSPADILSDHFKGIQISGQIPRPGERSRPPGWVGGFAPDDGTADGRHKPLPPTPTSSRRVSSPPLFPQPQHLDPPPAPPFMMPIPEHYPTHKTSLTTQYALEGMKENDLLYPSLPATPPKGSIPPPLPARPHSDPQTPQRPPHNVSATPPRPHPGAGLLATPASPASPRNRVKSSPSSLSGTSRQCSGTTKSGERCKNSAKTPTPLARVDSDADDEIERYCHIHMKEVLKPTGFHSPKADNAWVEYTDWIPSYLQKDTQAALRHEMNKLASKSDKDGYIYAFEIRDKSTLDIAHIKVGRSVLVGRRLAEWSKQCGTDEKVLRGYHPCNGPVDPADLMNGRVAPADPPGPFCSRLERLVHLELADIAHNSQHLLPHFPKIEFDDVTFNTKEKMKRKCPDCQRMHKEIFSFERFPPGKRKGQEWELIVQPILKKWGKFVDEHVIQTRGVAP